MYGYSKKEKIILYIFNIMKIPTYLFIIFCLLLVLITFFIHYQNNNKLSMKNGQLYLTTHRNVESFQNFVPNNLSSTENWNDLCVNSPGNCENKDMTKESLKAVLDQFKQFIEDNKLDDLKNALVGPGSPQWEFVTKQKVYNITHSHDTVGELIYHLKNLDFNIFIQLFNKIGYEKKIVENLYDKVNEIMLKKEYLDIKDGDIIAIKIKMVHKILKKLKEEYEKFQISPNRFDFSNPTKFNTIENCKIVKQSSPYSEYSEDVFANKTLGCPSGHYLKGMSYNVDDTTFTQNFHCCELKPSQLKQSYNEKMDASSVINSIEPNNAILSNFSFDINETFKQLGNYEQTDIDSNLSSDSINLADYPNFNYESKIYLVYIFKQGHSLSIPEADAIISELNTKSSLTFIIPEKNIIPSSISIDKTGYVKENNDNVAINLSGTTSTSVETGIFSIVYGEKNHIKYAVEYLYGKNIKLYTDIKEVDTQEAKSILNVEDYESKTINFNGIYNKQQNSFTNINNPLIVLNYNSKLNYWTLEYNKVPIIYYADIATATLSPMMKEVFDDSQLIKPKYYYNKDEIVSTSINLNGGQYVKKLLNITINGNSDYSGDYIFKQLSNNRPEYTKQHNELITLKWNNEPDKRRWEINFSGKPKFTNYTNSISVPTVNWKQIDKSSDSDVNVDVDVESIDTSTGLKDYIILTKSGNFLKPKLDILTKKFMLEDSQIAYKKNQEVPKQYIFNIIKEIDTYYVKNKQLDLFINVTNEGKIILSNSVNKTPLNMIKQNSRYLIRLPNENKLGTLENLFLRMKPSFNILNPEDNHLFEIINISQNKKFPVKTNYSYYENKGTTSESISLTIPEKMSGYNEKEIICQTNEYVSQLLKTDNEIQLNCSKIPAENNQVKPKRIEFFKTTISDFYHSHDFIVEDPIHNISIEDSDTSLVELNKFKSKLLGTQVELYSKRDGEYLNQSQLYSPLQKILIMMVMMKLNNIDSVNLDTNSLFEYFSKQNIFDIYYTELLKHTTTTLGPGTTTTTLGPGTTTTTLSPGTTTTTTLGPGTTTTTLGPGTTTTTTLGPGTTTTTTTTTTTLGQGTTIEVTKAVEFYSSSSRDGKYKEYDDSTDLEFGYDGSKNIIVLNFDISNISNITQATLKFYFDNNGDREKQKNHMKIYGIKKNTYEEVKNEIDYKYAIDSDIYTNNYIYWTVTNYDSNGNLYPDEGLIESPNISNILNELVSTHSINNIFLLIVPDEQKFNNITNPINNENILQAYGNIKAHDDSGKPITKLEITYVS